MASSSAELSEIGAAALRDDRGTQRSVPIRRVPVLHAKLALAIPTMHEAENLPGLLHRVRTVLDALGIDYEILIVDDDSRDGTEEIVADIARDDPRIRLLVRRGESGLSGAILHAWENSDATIVGAMDADFQHPPELLTELSGAIACGCDLAIGSRYVRGGRVAQLNVWRRLLSRVAVWATRPVQRTDVGAEDPMSGFFLVRRDCVEGIQFQRSGFKLLLEILARARIERVREVPFAFGERQQGKSKVCWRVAVAYASLLARLYRGKFGWNRQLSASALD